MTSLCHLRALLPLLQVGAFPHYGRWSEWNGHFRDTVRQFVKVRGQACWASGNAMDPVELAGMPVPHYTSWRGVRSSLSRAHHFPALITSKPPEPHGISLLQGTDGPWVGNMASVLCGSPHIYVAAPGEQDWWVTGEARWRGMGQAEAQQWP